MALEKLCIWVRKRVEDRHRRNFSKVYTLFLGHSMGGLLAADAYRHFSGSDHSAKHLPIGILAYDTPYIGLHPDLFDRTAMERASQWTRRIGKAFSHQLYGKSVEKAGGAMLKRRWGILAVTALSTSALAAVVVARNRVQAGVRYITDHLEYMGALVREDEMYDRLKHARAACGSDVFHCFYTCLDVGEDAVQDRTFIIPPSPQDPDSLDGIDPDHLKEICERCMSRRKEINEGKDPEDPISQGEEGGEGKVGKGKKEEEEKDVGWKEDPHFTIVPMAAIDELQAHTNMFNPNVNYNYDCMMEDSAWLITQRVHALQNQEI